MDGAIHFTHSLEASYAEPQDSFTVGMNNANSSFHQLLRGVFVSLVAKSSAVSTNQLLNLSAAAAAVREAFSLFI